MIIRIVLAILLMPFIACANGGSWPSPGKTVPATGGTVYTDCSQRGTADFYWNGDYTSSTTTGCISGGTRSVTLNSSTVVTGPGTPPESGGNVLRCDAGEEMTVSVSTADIVSGNTGTVSFDVYISASTGANDIYNLGTGYTNRILSLINTDGTIQLTHFGAGNQYDMTTTTAVPDATWTKIILRWDTANDTFGVKIGANAWENESRTLSNMASQPTTQTFGALYADITNIVYFDNARTWNTYEN